ncbi:MAG: type II toxin-antitoxin system HicB family antitoxin [Thermodesulfobacteriota bacterium]|jgi:predicted RNase H-like HicB family nuclease
MLTKYINSAMEKAHYEILEESRTYYSSIPGFKGVWAEGETLEACRQELQDVLEEWIIIRLKRGLSVPALKGVELKINETAQHL